MKKLLLNYPLLITTILLIWIKTYLVYKLEFKLPVESILEELILVINPLSSLVFWLTLVLAFPGQANNRRIIIYSIIMSSILYVNVVYYRFFNDFITIPVLFQTSNASDLGNSIFELIKGYDVLFWVDSLLLLVLFKKWDLKIAYSKKQGSKMMSFAIIMFLVNVGLVQLERPQLLTRTFDREMLVKYIGTYNYHVYDAILQSKAKVQRVFADSSEISDIENYVQSNHLPPNPKYFGKARGKNLIVISLESTQNFVINRKVNGKEITPFLNNLIKESYYFNNFYHQTGQGKTSDSEFLLENSLFGLPSGAVFFTHSQNEYNATPEILGDYGYTSTVFHANNKSFWNRDVMYQSLGYNRFYSEKYFSTNEENSVGWGLKDANLYSQSMKYIESLPQPFYAKYITLTNHFPFTLDKEDKLIPEWTSNDGVVNRYLTTIRYEDAALETFFNELKANGLYENSIFIIYGDHYGVSENHNEAMGELFGKEITPFETAQLQKVPLIVHIPGEKGKTINTVSGQIDLKPTILHLLGIHKSNDIQFGSDLFSEQKNDFVVFRDGSFVTKDYVYTENTCYEKSDGSKVDYQMCSPYSEKAKNDLELSDKVVYGDLLRFLEDRNRNLPE